MRKDTKLKLTVHSSITRRPLREVSIGGVKCPRQLRSRWCWVEKPKGREPYKEKSKWTSVGQPSEDSVVGELRVFLLFCFILLIMSHVCGNASLFETMITKVWSLLWLHKLLGGLFPLQRRSTFPRPHSNYVWASGSHWGPPQQKSWWVWI